MTVIKNAPPYCIGSEAPLTQKQQHQLTTCFEQPVLAANAVLGGRAAVSRIKLEGIGPVIVKRYSRGGVIRYFNRHTYLKFSRYRCQSEYELLQFLRRLGVRIPRPVAYAYEGRFFYHAWMVTHEIRNTCTLAEFSRRHPENLRPLMADLSRQLAILVENQIHHVDLHPGNVLVDDHHTLYIIDFDKARTTPQNRRQLQKKYLRRWQRAVLKYHLPPVLNHIADH